MAGEEPHDVLYHYKSAVKVGELERYVITYELYDGEEIPTDLSLDSLWLKVKNMESFTYRAAYLMGPFILYCDIRTQDYHHSQKIYASVDQPKFEPNLQAQQRCIAELSLHQIKKRYVWIVDVVSQILFSTIAQVAFEITIGKTRQSLSGKVDELVGNGSFSTQLTVSRLTTLDLWNLPPQLGTEKQVKHLVILTHGLHSNVSTDMQYLMEQIYKAQVKYPDEQIMVKGYTGNVCQTERGIKYMGTRLAKYIVEDLYDESIKKISFVGHSLGGPVQSFAIAYIAVKHPWFFQKVAPINFVSMASPFLGIVTDNPAYVNLLLSFGVIGKAGQDLSLEKESKNESPLLYLLSGEPLRSILAKFRRRTLYMNAINDGIVPLYTASLLFLDYDEVLQELKKLKGSEATLDTGNGNVDTQEHFFCKNLISPLNKVISLLAPQKFPGDFSKIPKKSFLESAMSTIIPPLPDQTYILDPESRKPVIIHDKIYTEEDLPPLPSESEGSFEGSTNILLQPFTMRRGDRKKSQTLEEAIARRWHKGLSWRKVVVSLKPDAHNNIVVRRRFSNAYGWPVADHLIDTHFNGDDNNDLIHYDYVKSSDELIPQDQDGHLIEPNRDYAWITRVESTRLFDEGPTGMISTVSEMLDSFSKKRLCSQADTKDDVSQEQLAALELEDGKLQMH
ncbi:YDL109C and ROG1 (YGL144C) [Zygosaccharomyces parabailii]|nr:YDL109C and ROG1 (YGL144C) [Zygosaccharomyces parabailii]CDH14097.1 related to lipase ROG1 [Zygosaccharomyces bailii ISA1307]SJM86244.1 probable Putative lipase ROG1 [Zygosaccharomyces bailii]